MTIKRGQVDGLRKLAREDKKAAAAEHAAKKANGGYLINGVDTDIFVDQVFRDARGPIE